MSEINRHLVREPTAFGLLERLATSELWEFTDAEQTKILETAHVLFRPFEQIYLANPKQVQAHPNYPELCNACALIRTGGWPGVWQALWSDKRLDSGFCEYALEVAVSGN